MLTLSKKQRKLQLFKIFPNKNLQCYQNIIFHRFKIQMISPFPYLSITLLILIALAQANIEINTKLSPQNQHVQPPQYYNKTLFLGQLFVIKSPYLTQNQHFGTLPSGASQTPQDQSTIKKQQRLKTPEKPILPQNCAIHDAVLSLEVLQSMKHQYTEVKSEYLYNSKYKVLYLLNKHKIEAYRYNPVSYTFSYVSSWDFNQQCVKSGAMDAEQNFLYIFSCEGIIRLTVKTVLTENVKIASFQQNFYGNKVLQLEGIFIWSSINSGIRIYGREISNTLALIGKFDKFRDEHLQIADVKYNKYNGLLYILGQREDIYIYERTSSNQFQALDKIQLDNTSGNFFLQVWQKNIFVAASFGNSAAVVQLQYHRNQVDLVRYYKNYRYIVGIDIMDEKLMIVTENKIDIYPINVDPRDIINPMNGVTYSHFKNIIQVKKIITNHYMVISFDEIKSVKLVLKDSEYTCMFDKQGQYELIIPEKCQYPETKKQMYYDTCIHNQIINLSVQQRFDKPHLAIFVILTLLIFLLIICFMMHWRKGKMQIIEGIVNQILRLKYKYQERVEFIQQVQPQTQTHNWDDCVQSQEKQKDEKNDEEAQVSNQ